MKKVIDTKREDDALRKKTKGRRDGRRTGATLGLAVGALLALTSCIDEDLSKCGKDYELACDIQVVTELSSQLAIELDEQRELPVRKELEKALAPIFSDVAHDVNLLFYNDGQRYHQEKHIVNAQNSSFTIYLPVDSYHHYAIANAKVTPQLNVVNEQTQAALTIDQLPQDTIDPHAEAIFVGNVPMAINDGQNHYAVNLYMQNATSALVIDDHGIETEEIIAYVKGMATRFTVADSTYHFDQPTVVRTHALTAPGYHAFHATSFPSRNASPAAAPLATNESTTTAEAQATKAEASAPKEERPALWKYYVYVKQKGKWTESILSIEEPLEAGRLRIIKAYLREDGGIASTEADVGISVQIDWKPGGQHDVEI